MFKISIYLVNNLLFLNTNKHDSSCTRLHNEFPNNKYDSVFAHKGVDLRNDEIITYDVEKTTISYLIEMEK